LEVVAKAIYPLNFYSGLSMHAATAWIISGLRSRRKNDTTPAPELFFSWTWLQLLSTWFSWVWLRSSPISWLLFQLRLLVVFTHSYF